MQRDGPPRRSVSSCSTMARCWSRASRRRVTRDSRVIEAYLGKKWSRPCCGLKGCRAGYSAVPVLQRRLDRGREGQFVSIVGPNGAGKTTLFKTISGIVRADAPARSASRHHDLLSIRPGQRPHLGIAHVPGRPPGVSLADRDGESRDGRDAPRPAGATGTQHRAHLRPGCRCWPSAAAQFAGTLSGGEQQMLAIGRGLASSPKLLMLDEPSMGLAPAIADFIFERLMEIRRAIEPDDPAGRAARRRGA